MNRLFLLLSCSAALVCAAELDTAKTVYVLSMSQGLDQYLANRLTNEHVFQVVTDPKLADVILTDRLGEGFQAKLETIAPDPEPMKPAKDEETDSSSNQPQNPYLSEPQNKVAAPGSSSNFGRNRGMVFLVDAKSRQVVWSTYDPSKSAAGKDLDRTASDIVSRLKKDLKRK
jgi:hypothetical protein